MTSLTNIPGRLQRLAKRLASRNFDYRYLRSINSAAETAAWAARNPIEMFNRNALRAKVVQGCVDTASCSCFVETGTYHAATAIGAQRFLGLPVWSCEIDPRNYLLSRAVACCMPDIHLFKGDSPSFLNKRCAQLKNASGSRPFFYLDAHENEWDLDSLPLAEELAWIFTLEEYVVMIDDFQVPGRAEFEARRYAGVVIDVALIKDVLQKNGTQTCYFPAYLPAADTGYPSGYCVFWRSPQLDAALETRTPPFPLNLLRPYALDENRYLP